MVNRNNGFVLLSFAKAPSTLLLLGLLLAMLLNVGRSTPALAQTPEPTINRAAVVVVYDHGGVESRCVGFTEESITGYDLLVRGEFAPRTEVTGMGASVCSIDGAGCGEGENCFCQCISSPCIYWTFWQQLPEGWRYANMGAAALPVGDGDVQGWVWGESRPNSPAESAPPALAFGDICTTDAVVYGIEPTTFTQTSIGIEQPALVALVVALPLLLGGAWWLLQRRKQVQP